MLGVRKVRPSFFKALKDFKDLKVKILPDPLMAESGRFSAKLDEGHKAARRSCLAAPARKDRNALGLHAAAGASLI